MAKEIKKSSLQENVLTAIGDFLYAENFARCETTKHGILELINMISDYYEEGVRLFPEVILSNDIEKLLKTIPNRELIVNESVLSVKEFKKAIKLCAPLATENWSIFIEVKENKIKYGLASAEMTETSPSIYKQTVGEIGLELDDVTIAYIRNISQKTVELVGFKNKRIVSLTLDGTQSILSGEIKRLAESITASCNLENRHSICDYLEKTINEAIKIGHGNLIGVVNNTTEEIKKLKTILNDGIYLQDPIDIAQLVINEEKEKINETSVDLRSFTLVAISMMNHDGITIFSNDGKVVGYHLFIKAGGDLDCSLENLEGGARSRAFESMKRSNLFECCMYKSQDGNIKYWEKDEE